MCGGRATRLDADVEKPLFEVADRPMIDRVLAALAGSRVERVYPVVSPHVPDTHEHLADHPEVDALVETPGEGYVADLGTALADDRIERPVLTVVADLPLLAPALVDLALDRYDGRDLTVLVPTALKRALDVSADPARAHGGRELAATGLNVVGERGGNENDTLENSGSTDPESTNDVKNHNTTIAVEEDTEMLLVSYDARLAVNVNRPADAELAEVFADGP